jgi:hypothetical protein
MASPSNFQPENILRGVVELLQSSERDFQSWQIAVAGRASAFTATRSAYADAFCQEAETGRRCTW